MDAVVTAQAAVLRAKREVYVLVSEMELACTKGSELLYQMDQVLPFVEPQTPSRPQPAGHRSAAVGPDSA